MENIIKHVLLFGTGPMAAEYVKVLKKTGVPFTVVGRTKENCLKFANENEVQVIDTPIEQLNIQPFTLAINAVSFENLANVNSKLINTNIHSILSEKPAGLDSIEVRSLVKQLEGKKINFFVAYNRRHFPSVTKLKTILAQEKISSAHFEFTEWGHVIEKLNKPKASLENWYYGNSTHVIDLFIALAGLPTQLSCYKKGTLSWHPNGSVFTGAGITDKNVLFNYDANWESAGRWGVDICTEKGKYSLRPLEKLFFIPKGSVQQQEIEILVEHPDLKPGLLEQVTCAIQANDKMLLSIHEHLVNCEKVYDKILNA